MVNLLALDGKSSRAQSRSHMTHGDEIVRCGIWHTRVSERAMGKWIGVAEGKVVMGQQEDRRCPVPLSIHDQIQLKYHMKRSKNLHI